MLFDKGPYDVQGILDKCPNARALFVSATISQKAENHIRDDVCQGGRGQGGSAGAAAGGGGQLLMIRTAQKTRPAFQADFQLMKHESKVETMRRVGEQVRFVRWKLVQIIYI